MKLMKSLIACAASALLSAAATAADVCRLGPLEVGFDLRLARPGARTQHVKPADMKSLDVSERDGVTTAVWKGHALCGEGFTVVATFSAADGGWTWRFRYGGNDCTTLDVEDVRFPEVTAPRTDRTAFVVPRSLGLQYRPDWSRLKPGQSAGGAVPHSFRFVAAYEGDGSESTYLDERGARGFAGRFGVENGPQPNTLKLVAEHWMPVTAASNRACELPFGGLIRRYRGGWYEAARIYRDWMRTQDWAKAARSRTVSPKLRDIALWMWNRGAADHVIAPAERFQDETGLKPAIDWYWWHKIPYDHGYPHFWPPREGDAAFRAAVARMKKRGIFAQVYTNGMTWDCDDETFEKGGGLESVIINKRGQPYERHLFNVYTGHALAYMCGDGQRHHDYFVGLTKQLADCGLDGLYIDQIGCCSLSRCWNPAHRHVPGGGTTQADGYRDFFRRIKRTNPDLLLSSEEPSEEYVDVNEAAICLWQTPERFGADGAPACEAVPVYPALHHGEIALFGTYAVMGGRPPWDPTWPTKDKWRDEDYWARVYPRDQFALEVCSGPVMGIQPCVHNLTLELIGEPRLAADWKFLKDTASFYHANRDFLYDGEMLAPGSLRCDAVALDMAIRGIYTTEKKLKITRSVQPAVRHGVWRAPDGKVGATLVNWTSEERAYELDCPAGKFAGKLPARSWKRIEPGTL